MTGLATDLERLHQDILRCAPEKRFTFQAQLARLIDAMEAHDIPVPTHILDLNEELEAEAIEAQFDNMPV